MMGIQGTPARLFYDFCLEEHVPVDHVLRGIDSHLAVDDLRQSLKPFYSRMGRPSVDPELMIRMLIVGYCMGIRSERRLFAHLKRILRLTRLRLRGPNGARDEFLLAATAQNLRRLARLRPMNMLPEMFAA
jgi:hypothetical protein